MARPARRASQPMKRTVEKMSTDIFAREPVKMIHFFLVPQGNHFLKKWLVFFHFFSFFDIFFHFSHSFSLFLALPLFHVLASFPFCCALLVAVCGCCCCAPPSYKTCTTSHTPSKAKQSAPAAPRLYLQPCRSTFTLQTK